MTFRHYTICQDTQGATVEVWRGTDEVACLAFDNHQRCFVELHVAIGPAERSRDSASFQKLVELAATIRHRHLLGVVEGGEDEGSNYYITSFLDGERLDTWLARNHPLPPWLALIVVSQLVEGLVSLAGHPGLLAGVEVFHAGLTLTGPHPDELSVKICDLGLSSARPASIEPQLVEARAIHETGRLLLYMLTGSLTGEPVTPQAPAGPSIPPELTFLLGTIFQPSQEHHPRTLEQLRTLTERCLHELSPELTARPDILPVQYRPRLPLTAHLPDGPATAGVLSNDFTLDTRVPDAADPYRYRGTGRATRRAVNVQVLPPANLLPTDHLLPALQKAWSSLSDRRDPHLLTPLAYHPEAPAPFLVEELPGKYTLDSLRRLRAPLDPPEVHLLLTKIDEAATAAAARHLPVHWRCPRLVPIQFTGPGGDESLPPPAQLARRSLTDWPAFTIKLRTWPLTLDFTQPDRFQLERLLPRDPALTGESPVLTGTAATAPPTARDFALLALWLLGGSAHLKENLKTLIYAAISARSPAPASRQEFLTRFNAAGTHRPTEPVILPKSRSKVRGKTGKVPPPATLSAVGATPFAGKSSAPPVLPPAAVPNEPFHQSYPNSEAEPEAPAMGFAEALFSNSQPLEAPGYFSPSLNNTLWPAAPEQDDAEYLPYPSDYNPDAPPEGAPLGFMEAAGQSTGWDPGHDSNYHHRGGTNSTSRWMLLLIVFLIAAALAALMAQISGQAIWLK